MYKTAITRKPCKNFSVVPEIAVIARPGAVSRRGEEISIEKVLSQFKEVSKISEPGTLDGGDVLIIDNQVYIGISERTNLNGAQQLSEILKTFGYESKFIHVEKGLHLKSDVNYVGKNSILVTKNYYYHYAFAKYVRILVNETESYAANSLLINDRVIIPSGFPTTTHQLKQSNFDIIELDMSESQKMDGGLTCLSLRF